MARVKLVSRPQWGLPGLNSDERSSIFRPTRILRDEGKPPGVLSFAYLAPVWEGRDDLTVPQLAALVDPKDPATWVRTLGSFCYTAGGRILFTPGWHGVGIWKRSEGRDELHGDFVLDHITLDADLKHWHATSTTNKYLGTFATAPDGPGCRWFYVALAEERLLEETMAHAELSVEVPDGDLPRWGRAAQEAYTRAAARLVKPGDNRQSRDAPSFLHLEFAVMPKGARPTEPRVLPSLPSNAGERHPQPTGIAFLEYSFDLPGCPVDIWLGIARISGSLAHPVWIGESTPGR